MSTIRMNPELEQLLAACSSQYEQVRALDAALTSSKRIKAKRHPDPLAPQSSVWVSGVLFRDAALIGPFEFNDIEIVSYGLTSDLVVCLPADLATGLSVLRIEGGGHWIEGTLGLVGSGAFFTMSENPTAENSIMIASTMRLVANSELPTGLPDRTPPDASLALSTTNFTAPGTITLTATIADSESGIDRVEFYCSGLLLGSKTAAPWTAQHNITVLENGTRHYYIRAYDKAGNVAETALQPVTCNIPYASTAVPAVAVGAKLVDITFENKSGSAITNVPVTFGQTFAEGAFPSSGANLELRAADNSIVACQLDVRNQHADGSIRHAVISAIIPSIASLESKKYDILRKAAGAAPTPAVISDFPGLDAVATFNEAGTTYSISLASLLAGTKTVHLSGNVVTEWEMWGIPKTASGVEHEYLSVRFYFRGYKGQSKGRVDIAVENTWGTIAGKELTYDALITVGGETIYDYKGVVHHPHARYRKYKWWNTTQARPHVAHNFSYLIQHGHLPNYDTTVTANQDTINTHLGKTIANNDPLQSGTCVGDMAGTGGRSEIGILPGYAALHILSNDQNARTTTLNQGDLAGSWSVHRRDKATGQIISLTTNPTYHPDYLPANVNTNTNHCKADTSHQPDMWFLPYLTTGDMYYKDEGVFYGIFNAFMQNRDKREQAKGLVHAAQLRGQAWCMRTLAHLAWLLPTGAQKTEMEFMFKSNVDYYLNRYVNGGKPEARLGVIIHQFENIIGEVTYGYQNVLKVWMDDFFTQAIGRAVELGFKECLPLLAAKSKYTAGRLYGAPGYHWQMASAYVHRVRLRGNDSPYFHTLKEVFEATMSPAVIAAAAASPTVSNKAVSDAWAGHNTWALSNSNTRSLWMDGVSNPAIGDLDGYSDSATGYPSNLQPAIAYCASYNTYNADAAWAVFNARTVKPYYGSAPEFAIIPRA